MTARADSSAWRSCPSGAVSGRVTTRRSPAWLATDIILAIPFIKNILRQDYRYLYGEHHRRKAEKAL